MLSICTVITLRNRAVSEIKRWGDGGGSRLSSGGGRSGNGGRNGSGGIGDNNSSPSPSPSPWSYVTVVEGDMRGTTHPLHTTTTTEPLSLPLSLHLSEPLSEPYERGDIIVSELLGTWITRT